MRQESRRRKHDSKRVRIEISKRIYVNRTEDGELNA
jgi:hypothetical protein